MKEAARSDPFKSSGSLVTDVLRNVDTTEDVDLPNMENLKRYANRAREALRPKQPTDLNFEVYNPWK